MMKWLVYSMAVFLVGCASQRKEDRERAVLHMKMGTGYLSQGNYPRAMTELTKAESLDPDNPSILNN